MKTYYRHISLIILLAVTVPAFSIRHSCMPAIIEEKVILFTDRSVYIAGELIQFSATLVNSDGKQNFGQSHVLYSELITPGGKTIANSKCLFTNSVAEGCLAVPGDILTGTYYLRAYTRLMRNNGPESYGYRQIRIVNPGRIEILDTDNSQNIPALHIIQPPSEGLKDILMITADKAAYTKRETITLSVQPVSARVAGIKNICVSVIPEGTKSSSILIRSAEPYPVVKTDYYPENHGLSLTGKLTEASSANPLPGKKVNLSIIGEGRDFLAVRTDSIGRFFFALPSYYGSRDLFICAEKTALMNVKIWVDNDFCTTPIHLPSPEFNLSEQERQNILNMNLNVQINSRFYNDSLHETQSIKEEELAFYGKPSTIIYLDKYIQLPTLEEYFNELPSLVKVRKHKGEPHFEVLGSRGISFYDPLVLVDWVAVDEPSKVLAASPQNISRIEVVNEDYVKGGEIYGGIISIISKKSDFAGIDLPSAGLFVNYRFLAKNHCLENTGNIAANQPNARNTVLWKPALKIPVSQPEKIILKAPDTPGKYSVVLEGITTDGEIFSVTTGFEVKN